MSECSDLDLLQLTEQDLESAGKELWQLGRDDGASLLQAVLDRLKQFYVTDVAHERNLAKIQKAFDESKDGDEDGVLANLVYCSKDDTGSVALKGLLSLGLNPDLRNKNGQRPVSWCSIKGRIKCAEALVPCRPDLDAKTVTGKTLEELAEQQKLKANTALIGYRVKICDDIKELKKLQEGHGGWNDKMESSAGQTGIVLSSANDNGDLNVQVGNHAWRYNAAAVTKASTTAEKPNPWELLVCFWKTAQEREELPSIAQLACEEKWWALKNLCRRKVVPEWEKLAKYQGRNAVEWADYHGRVYLVQELRYLLKLEEDTGGNNKGQEASDSCPLTSMPADHQYEHMLHDEVETLKEGLRLCFSRSSEEKEAIKKQIGNLEQELKDLKLEVAGQIKGLKDQLAMMPAMISTAVSMALAGFAAGQKSQKCEDGTTM